MNIRKITCPECGFTANNISIGSKGEIGSDEDMGAVCKAFGSSPEGAWCKHFDKELKKLTSG